jgi:hypothetical protein
MMKTTIHNFWLDVTISVAFLITATTSSLKLRQQMQRLYPICAAQAVDSPCFFTGGWFSR